MFDQIKDFKGPFKRIPYILKSILEDIEKFNLERDKNEFKKLKKSNISKVKKFFNKLLNLYYKQSKKIE